MSPCPYTDAELLRLAVDQHADGLRRVVTCCPDCAERAWYWRRFAARIRRGLRRAACPSALTLGEHVLGILSSPQRLSVAAHVRSCPACTAELALTEQFLLDRRKTWVAALVPPPGVRAAVRGEGHPRLYAVGAFRVAVEWLPLAHDPARCLLQGMLISFPPGAYSVTARCEQREFSVAVDEFDQFTLDGLPAGAYELIILSDDIEVRVPAVTIGG